MRWSRFLVVMGVLCLAVPGCMRAQAKAPVAAPDLAMPEPPERVIVPAPEPEVADPAPAPAPPPPVAPRPIAPPRPAGRGTQPAPAPAPPIVPAPEPPPSLLLQTNTDPVEAEKQIKLQMSKAQGELDRAAGRPLSQNGRVQLDAARGLLRQADDALRARNLTLARELADKATSLASQLAR